MISHISGRECARHEVIMLEMSNEPKRHSQNIPEEYIAELLKNVGGQTFPHKRLFT